MELCRSYLLCGYILAILTLGLKDLLEQYKDKPTDFEYHIASIYELLGYKVQVTPASNDCGKDIIMWKDGEKVVVEVKLYSQDNLIGREKIQKLHSAMHNENAVICQIKNDVCQIICHAAKRLQRSASAS